MKKLEKAEDRVAKSDTVFKDKGSSEEGGDPLEGEALIEFKAKALMADDESLKSYEARTKARKAVRQEALDAQYAE